MQRDKEAVLERLRLFNEQQAREQVDRDRQEEEKKETQRVGYFYSHIIFLSRTSPGYIPDILSHIHIIVSHLRMSMSRQLEEVQKKLREEILQDIQREELLLQYERAAAATTGSEEGLPSSTKEDVHNAADFAATYDVTVQRRGIALDVFSHHQQSFTEGDIDDLAYRHLDEASLLGFPCGSLDQVLIHDRGTAMPMLQESSTSDRQAGAAGAAEIQRDNINYTKKSVRFNEAELHALEVDKAAQEAARLELEEIERLEMAEAFQVCLIRMFRIIIPHILYSVSSYPILCIVISHIPYHHILYSVSSYHISVSSYTQ